MQEDDDALIGDGGFKRGDFALPCPPCALAARLLVWGFRVLISGSGMLPPPPALVALLLLLLMCWKPRRFFRHTPKARHLDCRAPSLHKHNPPPKKQNMMAYIKTQCKACTTGM